MENQLSESVSTWLGNSLAAMAEIYREGCMDMDHPRQDVQADALREETRKLQRPVTSPVACWKMGEACSFGEVMIGWMFCRSVCARECEVWT